MPTGILKRKLIRPEIKIEDAALGRVSAIVSTEDMDRDGDIIRQNGWNLDNFADHPMLIASHRYDDLTAQLGTWDDMEVKGKQLIGVARYYVGEGNATADWAYNLAQKGDAAFSVGFIPDMTKAERLGKGSDGGFEFRGQELLEVSQVTVPSNARALQMLKSMTNHPVLVEVMGDVLRDMPEAKLAAEGPNGPLMEALIERLSDRIRGDLITQFADLKSEINHLAARMTPEPQAEPTAEAIQRDYIWRMLTNDR